MPNQNKSLFSSLSDLTQKEEKTKEWENQQPRYLQPKPESWVFLGQYNHYDLYYSPQNTEPNVMVRWGNEPDAFTQGLSINMDSPLQEAMVRTIRYLTFTKI